MTEPSHQWERHLTPEQQIREVERQIKACEEGKADSLSCPYCGWVTPKGETLCCLTMGKAVRAVLQRLTSQELAETAERIAEMVSRN